MYYTYGITAVRVLQAATIRFAIAQAQLNTKLVVAFTSPDMTQTAVQFRRSPAITHGTWPIQDDLDNCLPGSPRLVEETLKDRAD